MRDAGILDGDLLVVDRAAKPVNGSVVVVAGSGEYTVKRLRRGPDCIWLDPANPRYQPVCVYVEEELHVFGVVKHAITRYGGLRQISSDHQSFGVGQCVNFATSFSWPAIPSSTARSSSSLSGISCVNRSRFDLASML